LLIAAVLFGTYLYYDYLFHQENLKSQKEGSNSSLLLKDPVDTTTAIRWCMQIPLSLTKWFYISLLLYLSVRLVWYVMLAVTNEEVAAFILNRLALCLFYSSFTIVISFWAEKFHSRHFGLEESITIPNLKLFLLATNLLLYAFQTAIVLYFVFVSHEEDGDAIYNADIVVLASVSLVMALLFLVYGLRTAWRITDSGDKSSESSMERLRLIVVTAVFIICFLLRMVMFLYRPITNQYVNNSLFRTLSYLIPEIVPALTQLYMITTTKKQTTFNSKYIENLYNMSIQDE